MGVKGKALATDGCFRLCGSGKTVCMLGLIPVFDGTMLPVVED
jgi:hypothetical protein